MGSYRLVPAAHVTSEDACPFARCADVHFDMGLGVLTVNGAAVQAITLLVVVLRATEDEEVATIDQS